MIEALKTWNLLFCLPCDSQLDIATKQVNLCEKCLLYVTPESLSDSWFAEVVTSAVEKARQFSRDILLVLKDRRLTAESLNKLDLQEFPATDWPPVDCDTSAIPEPLVSWLFQDVALAPIRQMPRKISGYYEAFVYYYGFLDWILRDHKEKMKKLRLEIGRPGARVALPLLIVMPESCRVPNSFDEDGGKITTTCNKYVFSASHYSGRMNRPFKKQVRELLADVEKRDIIYFCGEFPAILLTLYETHTQVGMTEEHLNEIRDDFYRTLQSLLCHPDNRHCVDQFRLVLWPDNTVGLYDFLLPIVRSVAEEQDASSLVYSLPNVGRQLRESSFSRLKTGNDLRTLLDGNLQPYLMRDDVSPRGVCLLIDISNVEVDVLQQLRHLFAEQFDFDVRDHRQTSWDELESLMIDVAQEDHSQRDAFVCCVVARGRMGTVRTSDGNCNPAVNLANIFSDENCETLSGKPKLFIIQTVDDGTNDNFVFHDSQAQVQ